MIRFRIAGLALLVIGGCSSRPQTIDTSGSHPAFGTTTPMTPEAKEAEVDTGRLLVFTPRIPDGSTLAPFSGYTVFTEDGHKVASEDNHRASTEGPVERRLAPGRYFVRLNEPVPARDFWVTIEKGRVTRVENRAWNTAPPAVK